MPWRSAEQLVFAEDPAGAGPAFGGALFALNQSRIILKPVSSHGSAEFAAIYRCQAPDPDCQCWECLKGRRPVGKAREHARDVRRRKLAGELSKRSTFES